MTLMLIGAHLERDDIDGATVIEVGPLFVSALEVDGTAGVADRRFVQEVAMLRQRLSAREIFVAFRYGATVASESEAAEKCQAFVAQWEALLRRWRGHVELTLKIALSERHAGAIGTDHMERPTASRPHPLPDEVRLGVETAFADVARLTRWLHRSDGGWEYAVLAARDVVKRLPAISAAIKAATGEPFLLSGPWPLEVFARD